MAPKCLGVHLNLSEVTVRAEGPFSKDFRGAIDPRPGVLLGVSFTCIFFFFFLRAVPVAYEIPRLRVELEL